MSEELKPCPFCGEKIMLHNTEDERLSALWRVKGNNGNNRYQIICHRCDSSAGSALTESEAIEAWNKRDAGTAIRTIVDAVMDNALERRNGSS